MILARRSFLTGIIAACVAPAIVRSGLIMPIKPGLVMGGDLLPIINGGTDCTPVAARANLWVAEWGPFVNPLMPRIYTEFRLSSFDPRRIFSGDMVTLDANGCIKPASFGDRIIGVAAETSA